jgi:hypothetical protein
MAAPRRARPQGTGALVGEAAGADAEQAIRRAAAGDAGEQRHEADQAEPAGGALEHERQGKQSEAEHDAERAIDAADVPGHGGVLLTGCRRGS